MDIPEDYDIPELNHRNLLTSLQQQCAYELNVHIEKGERLFGNHDKGFYQANWIDGNNSPIVLVEKRGSRNCQEILYNLTLDHPHIIKTYGLVNPNNDILDHDSVLLLQEYAKDGDLGTLLSNRHFVPDQSVLLEIFIQIADAMIFLSEKDIVHGDLACRNVLVIRSHPHDPKKNLVKLIDFGLTRNNSGLFDDVIYIPVRYAAPEILRSNGQSGYSGKSDAFSFGTFMHECCSFGEMPYQYINDDQEVRRQKLEGNRLTRPDECEPNIWKLINLCWNDRPESRPNFREIHTQLKNIQNVESSPSISNSSSRIEKNSSLFPIEFEICRNCQLRYTDYKSHLNNCKEEQLTCDRCFKKYRRAVYHNHKENCEVLLNDDSFQQALELLKSGDHKPFSLPSKDHLPYISTIQTNNFDSNRSITKVRSSHIEPSNKFDHRPPVSSKRLSPTDRIPSDYNQTKTPKTSDRRSSSQLNADQLPCESCGKLFKLSDFRTHQRQCIEEKDRRIELKRQEIERQKVIMQTECEFCKQKYSISELESHQTSCPYNPENVADEDQRISLSLTRSISDPNLNYQNPPFTNSTSSNESNTIPTITGSSKSKSDWKRSNSLATIPKPPAPIKPDKPSPIRKFLSCLFRFKKK